MWILTRLNDADGELMFWGNERKGGVVVGLDRCMMCLHTIHFGVGQKVYNLQHNNPEPTSLTIPAAPLFSSEASSDPLHLSLSPTSLSETSSPDHRQSCLLVITTST